MFPGCVFNAKALVQWSYTIYAGRFLHNWAHWINIVVFKTCPHQRSEGGAVAVRYLAPPSHITLQGNIAEVLERCQHNFSLSVITPFSVASLSTSTVCCWYCLCDRCIHN